MINKSISHLWSMLEGGKCFEKKEVSRVRSVETDGGDGLGKCSVKSGGPQNML